MVSAGPTMEEDNESSAELRVQLNQQFDHILECLEGQIDGIHSPGWLLRAFNDRRGLRPSAVERRGSSAREMQEELGDNGRTTQA